MPPRPDLAPAAIGSEADEERHSHDLLRIASRPVDTTLITSIRIFDAHLLALFLHVVL